MRVRCTDGALLTPNVVGWEGKAWRAAGIIPSTGPGFQLHRALGGLARGVPVGPSEVGMTGIHQPLGDGPILGNEAALRFGGSLTFGHGFVSWFRNQALPQPDCRFRLHGY